MKFYEYIKKHKVINEEDLAFVKEREDDLYADQKYRPHISDRFQLIQEVGKKLYNIEPNSIVYSAHKSFDTLPLNNPDMNRRGLHLFRMIFSRYRFPRDQDTTFDKSGLVIMEDFLKDEFVKLVSEECALYPLITNKQPNNLLVDAQTPGLKHVVVDSPLKDVVLSFIRCKENQSKFHYDDASAKYRRNTFIQRVLNKVDDNDEQKVLHKDIFFPAIKFWYFPDEVKEEYGPFNFVEADMVSEPMLDFFYEQSNMIAIDAWDRSRDRSHPEGSMRIFDHEISDMGLVRKSVAVPANTLVIANVGNFHARGNVTKEWTRNSIHGSIRINEPFRP